MNKNTSSRQSDLNQRSSQTQQSSARAQGFSNQDWDRSETPSHAGQSNIEAPMSGSKMCGHAYDCNCSTDTAIHASEEHAPKVNRK
ncbi:hypothetical protein BGZ73_009084 [Actinomortierella ambigua]|nr:hypothetical protein BGZ73_009084 [Actinomortierella ambigua]